ANGSGWMITASTTPKIVVVAAMARARVSTATAENPGERRSTRRARRTSWLRALMAMLRTSGRRRRDALSPEAGGVPSTSRPPSRPTKTTYDAEPARGTSSPCPALGITVPRPDSAQGRGAPPRAMTGAGFGRDRISGAGRRGARERSPQDRDLAAVVGPVLDDPVQHDLHGMSGAGG